MNTLSVCRTRLDAIVMPAARAPLQANDDPSTCAPAWTEGSCSGFRLTGAPERATGLPVGLHRVDGNFLANFENDTSASFRDFNLVVLEMAVIPVDDVGSDVVEVIVVNAVVGRLLI